MANRIITAAVSGESIKLSNKIAGASGSCNAVSLSFTFSDEWDGTTKKVYFFDVNGANPVVKVLTADLITDGGYLVPIPAEPLAYAGEMTLTVKGVVLGTNGETAERVIMSATTAMKVLRAEVPDSDTAPVEPTATQTEQLQAEIDTLTSSIVSIPTNVAAAEASATAAQTAQSAAESAQADAESASTSAQGYATNAGNSATAAAGSATDARTSKTSAESSASTASSAATEASGSATAASASASAAASSERAAASSASAAEASATAAGTSETNAAASAASALSSKNDAETAKAAAESAKEAAEGYSTTASTKATEAAQSASDAAEDATSAESWAVGHTGTRTGEDTNNAKYWCESAAQAAGGGVTSFNGRGGAVAPQAGDYTAAMTGADATGTAASAVSTHNAAADAHASLFAGKSNTGHTHTPQEAGADASGTAASAVSTHNSSATAHSSRFSAKADVADLTAHTGNTGNPHGVTAAQAGADPAGTAAGAVSAHNGAADAHASLFAGKSNTGHTHDDRYYTESEADTLLAGKAASSHNHSASNITSGTLPISRGGTGAASAAAARTALGAQAVLTAGTNITISGSTISATGGILPRIVATAPTGSTVTCSKDATTLTATEAAGTWTFDLPDYGTWTVTATLSGQTATESVVVDQVKLYTTNLSYLSDVFSENTWAKIISACQSGSVPAAWVPGNQKAMTINGASYTVTIIGKNHDTYTGGGTAPLTFQLQDCYGTKKQMNGSNTNSGGWASCAMRTTHLPAILALMPAEAQTGIKAVDKLTSAGSQSSTINTSSDKLFLLSEIEIFGSINNSKSGEGSQYAYYAAGNSKVKNFDGSADIWWERSPNGSSSTSFCYVSSNGNANYYNASSSNGVAFGFCF